MPSDRFSELPPANLSGISRPGRGKIVVKPKHMKATLARLWGLTKGQRKGLGGILVLSALSSASAIASPLLIGASLEAIAQRSPLAFLLLLLLSLYIAVWLVSFLEQYFMAHVGQRIIHAIRCRLFDSLCKLPVSFFDAHLHGELMSRLNNDVDNISTTLSSSLTQILTYSFTIVGIFISMLTLSPLLTLITLFGLSLIIILTRFITKRTQRLFKAQAESLGSLCGQTEESISGLLVVKAFAQEKEMIRTFSAQNEQLCKAATSAMIFSGYLMPLMNVINNLCFMGISVVGGIMAVKGMCSIALISAFLLYIRQFTRPFVEIANIYNNFQTAVAGAERIFEIMDEPREKEDRKDALPLATCKGEIELEDVHFGYSPDREILHGISLKVPAGSKIAIVGETGAGKTTIINLLTRFYDVNEGRILLDGHDIRDYRLSKLRRSFSVVLQDTALFARTIGENISYGCPHASQADIERAATIAGATPFISHLPHGFDTLLNADGSTLSQGERQLITIARAILADAPILILDEATSSVDTVTEMRLRSAMSAIMKGKSSIIIAHRLATIRNSDRIILLSDGRITETGTHAELMALGGRYAAMYRTQSGI